MSETARKLFDGLKTAKVAATMVAPGLKTLVPELGAELSRLGTQGSMELASALFGNGAFVPYGPGQYTPNIKSENDQAAQGGEQSREGMEH